MWARRPFLHKHRKKNSVYQNKHLWCSCKRLHWRDNYWLESTLSHELPTQWKHDHFPLGHVFTHSSHAQNIVIDSGPQWFALSRRRNLPMMFCPFLRNCLKWSAFVVCHDSRFRFQKSRFFLDAQNVIWDSRNNLWNWLLSHVDATNFQSQSNWRHKRPPTPSNCEDYWP